MNPTAKMGLIVSGILLAGGLAGSSAEPRITFSGNDAATGPQSAQAQQLLEAIRKKRFQAVGDPLVRK